MKNNRRNRAWMLLVVVMVSLMLQPITALAASFTSSDAGIKVKGSSYRLGSTSTTWKKKLGTYKLKKSDGCTAGTDSYMYTYSSKGVKIETLKNKKGGSEKIISIILSKNKVGTIGGLKVGQTVDKMIKLYGDGYKKSGTTYRYTSGKYMMSVNTKATTGKITKITLLLDV